VGRALGPTWNLWQINIAPPDLKYGLALAPLRDGGLWQIITVCAIGAFSSWALREVEICRKLGMGYHVPAAFSCRDLRLRHAGGDPAGAARRLGPRFPVRHLQPPGLGVSNVGYQYLHFHYNPAHMIAVSFFFTTTLALRCTAA
jgi:photosynthetic reaction center L subunit